MLNGDLFSVSVPRVETSYTDPVEAPIADGCSNNSNYFTEYANRGTCCCDCDKGTIAV